LNAALEAVLDFMERTQPPCLLCNAPSTVTGLFLPTDSQLWGAPIGRQRTVVYPLCSNCADRPDAPDACELRISQELDGRPQ
jgi:hypothetical protein